MPGLENWDMYMFESHPRQLIFLRKSDCLGCAVLLCFVVCMTLLASFFLPSHLSLKYVNVTMITIMALQQEATKMFSLSLSLTLPLSHSPSSQPLVQEAEIRLIEMVHQMLSDGNLKFAQLLRNALVTKVPLYKYTVLCTVDFIVPNLKELLISLCTLFSHCFGFISSTN